MKRQHARRLSQVLSNHGETRSQEMWQPSCESVQRRAHVSLAPLTLVRCSRGNFHALRQSAVGAMATDEDEAVGSAPQRALSRSAASSSAMS